MRSRTLLILSLSLALCFLSGGMAQARPLPQQGAPVYGLLGTLRPSQDDRYTTELVTRYGIYPVVGVNPQMDRKIQEIAGEDPPVEVKVWGRAVSLLDESEQRQIVVDDILRMDQLAATATPTPTPTASGPAIVIVSESLSTIRSEPSAAGAVLGQVRQGREFEIVGRDSSAQWWLICCLDGQPGWISRFMVSTEGDLSAIPTVSQTAAIVTATPLPLTPAPISTPIPVQDWAATYFPDLSLQGAPIFAARVNSVSFDWGDGSPVPGLLPVDRFSARFEQTLTVRSGIYRFSVQADDGVRVWIGGELVIDEWHLAAPPIYQVERQITGPTSLRIEYFEAGGQAKLRFSYRLLSEFPDWQAAYFDNINLNGGPSRILAEPRTNPALSHQWSLDSPVPGVIPADNFSARWTGTFFFEGGDYLFWALADDGVRLWIDNILVLDAWAANPGYVEQTFSQIGRGDHVIRVEYFERGGLASISADWYRISP